MPRLPRLNPLPLPVLSLPVLGLCLSCTGQMTIGDPNIEVASLALQTTELGALQASECVFRHGEKACARYPNPLACTGMMLSVRGDGSVQGTCTLVGNTRVAINRVSDGIPIACRMEPSTGCIQCEDMFGNPTVDMCNRETELYVGNGFASDGAGTLLPGSEEAPTPPGGGQAECDELKVKMLFAENINGILAKEGLGFTWSPDFTQPQGTSFWHQAYANKAASICSTDIAEIGPGVEERTGCDEDAVKQGRCYCEQWAGSSKPTCRCARITSRVLVETCKARPANCDQAGWSRAVWDAYGAATQMLDDGEAGKLVPAAPPSGSDTVNPKTTPEVPGAGGGQPPWNCVGSPLVLDLAGDGLELTSVARGVTFDLTATGPSPMAWTRGADDALLVMDRDGNGAIDHGGELFGEATIAGGRLGLDGFAALAVLDRPDHGGNGNGLVEAGDLMFDQLQLWTDRNHDGVSAAEELRSLPAAGVSAVGLRATSRAQRDSHGNDLGLRGRFIRADGSEGLVVDVYFVTTDR